MEKSMRCTVCTWRGGWLEAESARRVRPSDIPPPLADVQGAYAERQSTKEALFGQPKEPPCPVCGHHLQLLKRASIRPAM